MGFRDYARLVSERLGEDPAGVRYALCTTQLEMRLIDDLCLQQDRMKLAWMLRGNLAFQVASTQASAPSALNLINQIARYRASHRNLGKVGRQLRDARMVEQVLGRFDSELMQHMSELTDPLLYRLVGGSAPDPLAEWHAVHRLEPELVARFGEQFMQRLQQQMRRATEDFERLVRQEQEREQRARQQGLPPQLGRFLR